ncbi:DUF4177 domain-containing protein [Myroides sp. M-43]|uniref:DUF4177 domain-containing protein n=1 Tax=Myroides oncorhynchi TaxID=2893756 RepID=UPI001E536A44|nr:DUF4177 domain-containing protein [Myroides oncorhynchi]MCC9043343.1 DUF4177 domain-containing protein [Myroides oncorhynchi]
MKRFEYKAIQLKPSSLWSFNVSVEEVEDVLNEYGKQGWELVTMIDINSTGTTTGYLLSFKREI